MHAFRAVAVLFASLAAAACTVPPAESLPAGADPAPLVSSLSVETAGDSVRLVLAVTNTSTSPVALAFTSGQSADFAVAQGGRDLWRWSADKSFVQAMRTETLPAGETRSFDATWARGAASGTLTATAWLTSTSHPLTRTAEFRLP